MLSQNVKPTTIEEYIMAAEPLAQEKLWQMHNCIRKVAPAAIEALKWNMPTYSYEKILVAFAVFKAHIGFYPMGTPLKAFAKELAPYNVSKVAVQFPLDKPLPLTLIKKMVAFRVQEHKDGTIKWRS
jgi:uncharacterized protein YdhG (YjbR/CyaY superfamily)